MTKIYAPQAHVSIYIYNAEISHNDKFKDKSQQYLYFHVLLTNVATRRNHV